MLAYGTASSVLWAGLAAIVDSEDWSWSCYCVRLVESALKCAESFLQSPVSWSVSLFLFCSASS